MNRKEAEEIIYQAENGQPYGRDECNKAWGYLEGYAEAEKRVEFLIKFLESHECCKGEFGYCETCDVLQAYRKEQ